MTTTSDAPTAADAAGGTVSAADVVRPSSVLRLHPLTTTPQGDRVVVGNPATGRFVALPEVGARALALLGAGRTVAEVERAVTPRDAAEPVDVLAFARSLVGLGFVASVDEADVRAQAPQDRPGRGWVVAPRARARWLFGRTAAVLAALAAVVAVGVMLTVDRVRPDALDVFFLPSAAQSLAVVTLATYVLAGLHELAHVLAAAALGVPARLRITRRLYFLTFETNLTGLWALPPRRRVGPLLAGMGFDALVLLAALLLRVAGVGPDAFLAAVVVVELSALVVQLFVFLRSDVYAVMTALLGCTVLDRTTRLLLRRTVRRLSPAQQDELAATPARDLAVARWYRWVHVAGYAVAAWFFVAFFVPSTWHLLVWVRDAVAVHGPATWPFWEALLLGAVLLSPRVVTGVVALRDLAGRHRVRAARARPARRRARRAAAAAR
ncbi:hypothetical protein [Cellulomonas fimi]|uniref:Uncharacterized protein n=1 Tax=Cellulomonas fimi (strain ATCC 484 / DSM 20113 / JCM 1341 / CCUG 24087 / LMG 16345 / NBRC 15513 / NCIMB 8980 / NCTC 7547 / NRS-133) TaxID=590998 RepID=F4H6Y6_CELFA|nr:hypothetical protein [Cellulomonas fimi]AEE44495.1 hypothetical protein Celf_0350 [Cellulomonas fimi ATCC 484]NNH06606.1 hypothetical protein [Cellulomonas fimi]VEH26475.1 Uncharacterised protein [Cellulomonas fimi]